MAKKKVKHIMHKGVITCAPDQLIQDVVQVVADTDVHAIIVVTPSGEVRGIIAHIDLLRLYEKDLEEYHAVDVMTHDVIDVSPEASVADAVKVLLENNIRRLLVTEKTEKGKIPVGILSTTDIIRDMRGERWAWYMG